MDLPTGTLPVTHFGVPGGTGVVPTHCADPLRMALQCFLRMENGSLFIDPSWRRVMDHRHKAKASQFEVFSDSVLFDGIGFHQRGTLWNLRGLLTTLSLYTFCYSCHSIIPTIGHTMQRKSSSPSTIGYLSMALIGYKMFGENMIALYIMLVNLIAVYAMVVVPIPTTVEEVLTFQQSRTRSCLIRTFLVFSTTFVSMMLLYFELVMAFAGSFMATMVSIVIPWLCYLKLIVGFRSKNRWPLRR
ncbi:hypothetical protein OSB04_021858 [Centaurea solstitialis]|uniref:Amino acid transporter transmembrane domain-containing protein n=1 Tax=Centaurea solstitialis TaxID=347529 RepID=A0AA38SUZ2_9ASTR|nr:hypothetical protein OSB04_021858 [Centaurea solstitialis]